ncbi:MAG: DNA repair protein RecN [Bacteroidales bacterium]|jgi:DNA repair protein RecN (Recombination protein N)|nr:DNA repair protein RecN [Bacteroidales bacterium]
MFKHLSVRNYVLIQELEIDFFEGLSIITGETGAGKSILLGALGLLVGQRADSNTLLDKTAKCAIEGIFSLPKSAWKDWFAENELDYAEDTILRREITVDGKSRAFVNDSPVNLAILKDLGTKLIDIHSQHQNIYLQSPEFQLQILDTYAQQLVAVAQYSQKYGEYRKLCSRLEEMKAAAQQNQADADYIRFRFEELNEAHLQDGEQEALEEEQKTLAHAGEIKAGLMQAFSCLDSDNDSITTLLKSTVSVMGKLKDIYPPAGDFLQRLDSALIDLRDIASETERLAEAIEHNPTRMDEVNERLDLIYRLLQKHHATTVGELTAIRDELDAKLAEIGDSHLNIEQVEKEIKTLQDELSQLSDMISARRKQAAPEIEQQIHSFLTQLGITNAVFKVDIQPSPQLLSTGSDTVKFLFSANKQQNLQELGKVASGGEMSRVMLSLKATIAGKISLPTLIFDEIDSGVSGIIAEKMGNILEQMAQFAQIINITHLPQIAAKGQHHYKVYKKDTENSTQTKVRQLTQEERVLEIARILSGAEMTEAALANARHLLKY